jgi:hypothetical protein
METILIIPSENWNIWKALLNCQEGKKKNKGKQCLGL